MISLLLAGLSTVQGDTLSADRHLNPEPEQLLASQLVGQLCQLQCYYGHRLLITDTRRHAAILTFKTLLFLETLDGDGDSGG